MQKKIAVVAVDVINLDLIHVSKMVLTMFFKIVRFSGADLLIIGRFFDESDSMVKYKAYGSALKAFIDVVNLIAVDLNYKI